MRFETNIRFDFINRGKTFLFGAALLVIIGVVSLLTMNLSYGIDFKAGTNIDAVVEQGVTREQVAEVLKESGNEGVVPVIGGEKQDRINLRFNKVLNQDEVKTVIESLKVFGEKITSEVNVVTPDMAREMGLKAIWAILAASVLIMGYVIIRFEWRFALAANLTILYDAFVVVTAFSLFRLQVDLPFIAAILTTIGYSINDKIVIFDRVRENLRFAQAKNQEQLAHVLNASIWQTMARNIYTALAVIIVTVCLLIFGSPSIKLFATAQLIGFVSSVFSTICLVSPLWFQLKGDPKKLSKQPVGPQVQQP